MVTYHHHRVCIKSCGIILYTSAVSWGLALQLGSSSGPANSGFKFAARFRFSCPWISGSFPHPGPVPCPGFKLKLPLSAWLLFSKPMLARVALPATGICCQIPPMLMPPIPNYSMRGDDQSRAAPTGRLSRICSDFEHQA